jgi:DNA-directed RNA polymerase specialized sigma24 family protein
MKETAKLLGFSYITVHRLLRRGFLKSSSALRCKRIPRLEIERFLRTTTEY